MPSAYPGNPTPATATLRANSTVYALNALAQPNPPTGLYYEATTGGTSGAAPPTWSTAELIGQTVADGTVVWTCMGSCVGAGVAPIVQEPVDSDAPTSPTVDIPFSTLADFIAFLQKWAALVNESNEFTVPQLFDFQSITDTAFGLESVPAGMTVRKGLWAGRLSGSGSAFMAWYMDVAAPAPNHFAITLALNVLWNGTNWAIQASGDDCAKIVFGDESISLYWYSGASGGTFADSAWIAGGCLSLQDGLSLLRSSYSSSLSTAPQGTQIYGVQTPASGGIGVLLNPPANAAGYGKLVIVKDETGKAGASTITVEVPNTMYLDGVANGIATITVAYGSLRGYWSDGTHFWTC